MRIWYCSKVIEFTNFSVSSFELFIIERDIIALLESLALQIFSLPDYYGVIILSIVYLTSFLDYFLVN